MLLTPGTRLGPYEIVALLGAGGMGEVYRAKDARLGRELALKVLLPDVSVDADRLSRFELEARSASSLNHPNIVTVYEIGTSDLVSYISMELVLGKTLRELLSAGPVQPKRLLSIAAQIAEGLAKAHEAGIVHRDLKPENVMVTRDGLAKILDFGLAKLMPGAASDPSQAATAHGHTQPGVVMGTVGYMSPEQAAGNPLDFRTDQFSFGSILYEMATGTRPFARNTAAETQAAIIREEPESLQTAAPHLPVALRWIVERCLAKDADERYGSSRDLARDLANLRDHASEISKATIPVGARPARRWQAAALSAGLLVAALGIFVAVTAWPRGRAQLPAVAPVRFSVSIPRATTYAPSEVSRGASISPDGTRLVIEAYKQGRRHLFLRRLADEEAVQLEGSVDATAHFWSPDSRFIAFFNNGRLKKIPADGGTPTDLCAATFETVGTWNRDGTILFGQIYPPGIFRVSDQGGEPTRVTTVSTAEDFTHSWPHFLPDGRRFLYVALGKRKATFLQSGRELRLGSLDSSETRSIMRLDSRAEYAPSGHLLFARDGALFAQPFDVEAGSVHGEASLVTAGINYFIGPANAAFSVSQTGVVVFGAAAAPSRLVWLDRSGKQVGELGQPSVIDGLRISPDGQRIAVDIEETRTGTSDLWVFELSRGVATRLHHDPIDEIAPVWSPDSSRIYFRSDIQGPPDIYELMAGDPGSQREVFAAEMVQQPEDISRDGRWLVYLNDLQTTADIYLLPLEGERKPIRWLATRFDEKSPRFSPDGLWIAYESDESGDPEVYLARTDGAAEKKRISVAGGTRPRWRRDGRELYYAAPGGQMMAVSIVSGPRLEVGVPLMLFRAESGIQNYDVTADGSRFLATVPLERDPDSPIRVIVNWERLLTDR